MAKSTAAKVERRDEGKATGSSSTTKAADDERYISPQRRTARSHCGTKRKLQ